MLIVAYLYNTNGMASWCWEAAHALHEAGQPVLLICGQSVRVPDDCRVKVIRFDPPAAAGVDLRSKLASELKRLSPESSGFVGYLQQHLEQQGIKPAAYLLNQTDLQDPSVSVPQYVSAWAYPTSFWGYASKIGTYTGWQLTLSSVRTTLSTLGWCRKDWRAYRSASGVLAVSQRLNQDLVAQGVASVVVHPGTEVPKQLKPAKVCPPYRMLTVALDLEDPRKRVKWLIEALCQMPDRIRFSLTLVGNASPDFQEWVIRKGLPATFTGPLARNEVQSLMADHDLFLFGSALDDWGYVLIEAMSRNLCAVAPNISPFDEILGDTGILYELKSQDDLTRKLSDLLAQDINLNRESARQRAESLFSRASFAESLLAAASLSPKLV